MTEQTKDTKAGMDRRGFLRTSGLAGLGLAGAAITASELGALDGSKLATKLGVGTTKVEAASLTAADIEVLQFALNLEYLEAEFYSYAVTGKSLLDNGIPIDGAVGTAGATTGGAKVPFESFKSVGPLKKVAEQLMRDETDHVLLIRSVLGPENTIAKPAIKLDALGAMNSLGGFLTLARDFEVTGVSAYGGAITLISNAYLQTAAQIALVEALHSGNLQLLVDLNRISITPLDAMDVVPPPAGVNYFDDSFNQALAVVRNVSEVLAIVYGSSAIGTAKGGFFPNGVNGSLKAITTT